MRTAFPKKREKLGASGRGGVDDEGSRGGVDDEGSPRSTRASATRSATIVLDV